MAMFRCFSFLAGKNQKNKKNELSSKRDFQTLLVQIRHPRISSEARDLEPTTFDVAVPYGMQKNSRCNVRVMSLESPVKAEVKDAYEGEDEKEHSLSIKREPSDFDLQGHESFVREGGNDPTEKEVKCPILYGNQANNQLEDQNDRYSEKNVDIIQSGHVRHVSDPGIGKSEFWASPKLKRSCSNLERRDVLRGMTHHLPHSKSQSFKDLQGVSANQVGNLESPRTVMSHCSADRVMLKRHSSSQVLPSGSKKLWWKLFLWSHRNIHKTFSSKSTQAVPDSAALNSQCGYYSDTLEPKQGKALRHVDSSESVTMESFNRSAFGENIESQRGRTFPGENSGFWPQNQWVAFPTESSSFARVDAWVKNLEPTQPLPEDDSDDDKDRSIVFPPPDAGRSMARSTSQLTQHPDANLSKEILNANTVVQSINPASTVAHISGIGIKAIPAISHLTNLKSINLSSNSIVHICPGFLPKSIHALNLSRNKISTLDGLRELTRLRVLDLSYNRISRVGQGLSNCTLIKELYLAGNKISDVEGLHRLLKLTALDLSFNKITTTKALGQLVANYNSLQVLNLLANPIQSNFSDDQLRKAVTGLLPKLVYLNRQPLNPQMAREVSTIGVQKAALGNNSRSKSRRSLKKVGHGGSSSSRVHRSSASVVQKSVGRTRSRNQKS